MAINTNKEKVQKTKVVTKGLVRFLFVKVFEPSSMEDGGEKKYSAQILISKKNKLLVEQINAGFEAAKEEGRTTKWGGKIPPNFKGGLRDGDKEKPDDPTYKGMWFINANNKNKPGLIDENHDAILDPVDFYSGCWGIVSINFFPYKAPNNTANGVGCSLQNIMKVDVANRGLDQSRLAGGASAEEDFKQFDSDELEFIS